MASNYQKCVLCVGCKPARLCSWGCVKVDSLEDIARSILACEKQGDFFEKNTSRLCDF